MNKFRLDLILPAIYEVLGAAWFLLTIAILLYAVLGRTMRATMVVICVLVCTQIWYGPLQSIAFNLRWVLLCILCLRTFFFMGRTPRAEGESHGARNIAIAIGALALCSALWGTDNPEYTVFGAGSFCLGLVVTFGLLWRLCDGENVMENFAKGALVLALVLFGGGFLVAGVSYATESWQFYDATHWGAERYQGLFRNPNAAGLIGTMLLPIVVAAPRRALGGAEWLRLPTCGLLIATIFLSGSRSALIGAAMSLVVLSLYRFGGGAVLTILLGGVVATVFMVASPVEDINSSAVGHISRTKHLSTLSGRMELWEGGWAEAQGHMVLGQGWGHSRVMGGDFDTDAVVQAGSVGNATNLHNAHLQLLIDVGLIGVGLFWTFCFLVVVAGTRILTAPKSPENAVGVVVFTSVMALLADSWVHGAIWSMGSPTTLAFWGLCVMTLKQGDRARQTTNAARAAAAAWRRPPAAPLPA